MDHVKDNMNIQFKGNTGKIYESEVWRDAI